MFSLANGKLIRINSDGSDGEPIQTKNSSLTIGTSILSDYCVSDTSEPSTHLAYEISTDNLGRVTISNKCGAQLLVNSESVSTIRPLFTNSQIEVPNGVRFRWVHSQDAALPIESEYASWSDPGKKNKAKSRWGVAKGRLTTHALHLLSSVEVDSPLDDSKNNGVHTFVDDNDENRRLEAAPLTDGAMDVCNFTTPKKTKALESDQITSASESIYVNDSCVLSISQMMLTSYIASETTPIAHLKPESAAYGLTSSHQTPEYISNSSSTMLQTIDQSEYSANRSASFAIIKSPTTSTPGGRNSKSMYLIDLTTPPTVSNTSAVMSKSCGRQLLKSAIQNSTIQSATKKMNTSTNTVKVNKHVVTGTPKTPHVFDVDQRSNVVSSTPIGSSKIFSKSNSIPSEEKIEEKNSAELISTAGADNVVRVEASSHVFCSISKSEVSSERLVMNSSSTSSEKNAIETAIGSRSNAFASNDSTEPKVESELAVTEQDANISGWNKSNRVSEITNLSAEEEDALLKIDGDTEENGDEFNEDLLLAESTDEEGDSKIDLSYEIVTPNTEPTKHQIGKEYDLTTSDMVASNKLQQTTRVGNISLSEAVDSFLNDLVNNIDESDSCNPTREANAGTDQSNYNETLVQDQEFSALHVSSSSDSGDITEINETIVGHNATVEPTEPQLPEETKPVVLCDTDSTITDVSYSAVIQSHSPEYSSCVASSNQKEKSDDIPDSERIANETQCNDLTCDENEISRLAEKIQYVPEHPIIGGSDGSFASPDELTLNEQIDSETSESGNALTIMATTTSDANKQMTLYEQQCETEKLIDSNNIGTFELCNIRNEFSSETELTVNHESALQTDCLDKANDTMNDKQVDGEQFEVDNMSLQSITTTANSLNTSQSVHCSAILSETELNVLLETSADSESIDETENVRLNSNNTDVLSIAPMENSPEIVSRKATETAAVSASTEVHNKEAMNEYASIEKSKDENQQVDQNIPASLVDTGSITTAVTINPAAQICHRMEPKSEKNTIPSDEQNLHSSFAVDSVDNGPNTSKVQNISLEQTNVPNENQQEQSEEAENVGQIDVEPNDMVLGFEVVNEAEDVIIEMTEDIDTPEEDASDIEKYGPNKHLLIDGDLGDTETSNSRIDDEPIHGPNPAGVHNTDFESNDSEIRPTENEATVINDIDVIRADVTQLLATDTASSDDENLSTGDDTEHKIVLEPAYIDAAVAENVFEQCAQEQSNDVQLDVESKDLASDTEVSHPAEDTNCDSDQHVAEISNVVNNAVITNISSIGDSSCAQQLLNQTDEEKKQTDLDLMSSDVITSDENIQDTEHSQIDEMNVKTEVMISDSDEMISVPNAQVDGSMNHSSNVTANESTISPAVSDDEQIVSLTKDGSTVDALILPNEEEPNELYADVEESEIGEKTDIDSKDTETYSEAGTERDAADLPIDEFDGSGKSNQNLLDSSAAHKISLDARAADEVAESLILNQSTDVNTHTESQAETVASDQVTDNVDDLEAAAVENESGIEESITNTDAMDVTGEHDDAKFGDHFRNVNSSESFNSCTSRDSNDTSIVSVSDSTEKSTTKSMVPINTNEIEEHLVGSGSVERSQHVIDSGKSEIVCVTNDDAITVDTVSDSDTDQSINSTSVENPTIFQTMDSDHNQRKEISPMSTNADQPALNANDENVKKTPRRKRLVAQSIPVEMSPRTPRQRQLPARFLESGYSTPTPRSTKKLQDKKMKGLTKAKVENTTEIPREAEVEIVPSVLKGPSQTVEERAENVDTIDAYELPSLKPKRLAKVGVMAASEVEPLTFTAETNEKIESVSRVPAKRRAARHELSEQDEPMVDVEKPKRGRRAGKTTDVTREKKVEEIVASEGTKRGRRPAKTIHESTEKMEPGKVNAEETKRGRRQIELKTNDMEDEKEDIAKMEQEQLQRTSKVLEENEEAAKSNAHEKVPKVVRGRRQAAMKMTENDNKDIVAATKVSPRATTTEDVPKLTRRKRTHPDDEITSGKSNNNVKDQIAEEKTSNDDPLESKDSPKKTAESQSLKTDGHNEKPKPEPKLHTTKAMRIIQKNKAKAVDSKMVEESENAHPAMKKPALEAAIEPLDHPKRAGRGRPKQVKIIAVDIVDDLESNAKPEKSAKEAGIKSSTDCEVLVNLERDPDKPAKRGRAAKDATNLKTEVITRTTTHDHQDEIEEHIVDAAASVKTVRKRTATGGRKKNHKEHAAIEETKSVEAVMTTVATEPHKETGTEPAVNIEKQKAASDQKSTRGRKKKQEEPAVIEENKTSEVATVNVATKRHKKTATALESASEQKPTRGRKKIQPELPVIDEQKSVEVTALQQQETVAKKVVVVESTSKFHNTRTRKKIQPEQSAVGEKESLETIAVTTAPVREQEEIAVAKPKTKKRVKPKDETSEELMTKRGKIHVEAKAAKNEEIQTKARGSRLKHEDQDVAVPIPKAAGRSTRATRSTKK